MRQSGSIPSSDRVHLSAYTRIRIETAADCIIVFVRNKKYEGSIHLIQEVRYMPRLEKGAQAPDFELQDQNANRVRLADYRGKKLLLYFYPRADTPGCTKQACSIRDSRAKLREAGIAFVGISPDTPDKQKKFDKKYSLDFPLLADTEHRIAEAYGAWGEKSMYGIKKLGIIRSSFLIDEGGKILDRWYGVKPLDTVPKALNALRS